MKDEKSERRRMNFSFIGLFVFRQARNERPSFVKQSVHFIMKEEEEKDFYIENGFYVFTAKFLKKRGYCCDNGCRHCPYKDD